MQIREFRRGDEPALWKVFFSAIHGTAAAYYNQEQINAWAPAEMDQSRWAERMHGIAPFVAEDQGTIVGYADVQPDGYIDHFFVAATSARQGVGSLLMQRIHEAATAQNIDSLYSNVSLAARPFFEHWGFHVEAAQRVEARGVEMDNFRMRKSLRQDSTQNPG